MSVTAERKIASLWLIILAVISSLTVNNDSYWAEDVIENRLTITCVQARLARP